MTDHKTKRRVEEWSVKDLLEKLDMGILDLSAEYQREVIWDTARSARLIDSIFKDIDIPKIYLAFFSDENKYECIDGKQRINSILNFRNGDLKLESGERISAFTDTKIFFEYKLAVSILIDPDPSEIQTMFYRLNIGKPLNGGELINAMPGDMRDFIFKKIGDSGPFVQKLPLKAYRFSREITVAQIVMNSSVFRGEKFRRVRYEDIAEFLKLPNNLTFDSATKQKMEGIYQTLEKLDAIFEGKFSLLNRKSVILSTYLLCEELIAADSPDVQMFPTFLTKLLEEVAFQARLAKAYKTPTKIGLLDKFQKNLQQASSENYSIEARHQFLKEKFHEFLATGEISS